MNWKEHYEEIKTGDKVKIIKTDPECHYRDDCFTCRATKDKIYTIRFVNKNGVRGHPTNIYSIEMNDGAWCDFPKECVQKV